MVGTIVPQKKKHELINYKKTPLRGGIERSRPSSSDCANFYSLALPLLLSGFGFPIVILYAYRFCIFVYGSPLLVYKSFSFYNENIMEGGKRKANDANNLLAGLHGIESCTMHLRYQKCCPQICPGSISNEKCVGEGREGGKS